MEHRCITGSLVLRGITALGLLLPYGFTMQAQDGPVSTLVPQGGSKQFFMQKPHYQPSAFGSLNAADACDLNGDGRVDSTDVQIAVNQALNFAPCTNADLHNNNTCTVLDVQVVATDVATGTCLVPGSGCVSTYTYPNTSRSPSNPPACPPPLPPNPNPPSTSQDTGPIHPCMYIADGVRYQAIEVTGVSGQQALNANLYYGTTCSDLIDVVFGGQQNPFFGNSLYWLIHFWDEPNTSAIWTVGNVTTRCIDYSKVADCN